MAGTLDIAKTKADLEKVEKKIATEQAKFEQSIASLRGEQSELQKEYAQFLRSELSSLGISAPSAGASRGSGKTRGKIDDEAIIAVLRKSGMIELSASEIKDRAKVTATANSLSVALGRLVSEGVIVKIGERRASKYRINDLKK